MSNINPLHIQPIGIPSWVPVDSDDAVCPNCKARLCRVRIKAKNKLLPTGIGVYTYFGCPACPYASPMRQVRDRVPRPNNRS